MQKDAKAAVESMLREGWQVSWGCEKEAPCPICGISDYYVTVAEHELTEDKIISSGATYACRNGHRFIARMLTFVKAA
jgi:hypothetical protein